MTNQDIGTVLLKTFAVYIRARIGQQHGPERQSLLTKSFKDASCTM